VGERRKSWGKEERGAGGGRSLGFRKGSRGITRENRSPGLQPGPSRNTEKRGGHGREERKNGVLPAREVTFYIIKKEEEKKKRMEEKTRLGVRVGFEPYFPGRTLKSKDSIPGGKREKDSKNDGGGNKEGENLSYIGRTKSQFGVRKTRGEKVHRPESGMRLKEKTGSPKRRSSIIS